MNGRRVLIDTIHHPLFFGDYPDIPLAKALHHLEPPVPRRRDRVVLLSEGRDLSVV